MTGDDDLVLALKHNHETAAIPVADRAMLRYVDKLTRAPATVTAADIEDLRKAGFSDAGILDICQVAAYYAFVNRIADGLGVELEPQVARIPHP